LTSSHLLIQIAGDSLLAWPHKDGKGLNVQLATSVLVSHRLAMREGHEPDPRRKEPEAKIVRGPYKK
jgi:hypothetical protein